jgi:hypothetical protein
MVAMDETTALGRVVRRAGGADVLALLAALPGADLTTLLLRVMRDRAARTTPAEVFRRSREDRFTGPAEVLFDLLRGTEDRLLSALPPDVGKVTLAPVVPLGTHSVVGTVHQDKVVATVRGTEVAADPTNGLALVAADRRARLLAADPRSADPVRLATVQRVVRAQRVDGPASYAHFGLLGRVSAGRDTGDRAFERTHAAEHLSYLASALGAGRRVEFALTVLDPRFDVVSDAVRAEFAGRPDVDVVEWPDRAAGRDYYVGFCFTATVDTGSERLAVGDGGFVDWSQRLLGNRKERMLISGVGIDRLAVLTDSR